MNVLSDKDIYEILDFHKIKINGIFQKDCIHELKPGFYVINLQSSSHGNGTHWCGLYFDKNKSLWYDSYGFNCPVEIQNLLSKYEYNAFHIQNIDSSSCGYYVIAFIKFLYHKKDKEKAFETFINLFKPNTCQNEIILKQLLE